MSRIGSLSSSRFNNPQLYETSEKIIQEQSFGIPGNQARAKFTEHRMIKARIIEFQTQHVFPVNASTDGVGRLTIGKPFGKLHNADQGEARWRFRRLPERGE
jgi:hypothetical protein